MNDNVKAQAALELFGQGYTPWDFYVVAGHFYISAPDSPLSECEVADAELRSVCLEILRNAGAPEFQSWDAYERDDGAAAVRAFRRMRQSNR